AEGNKDESDSAFRSLVLSVEQFVRKRQPDSDQVQAEGNVASKAADLARHTTTGTRTRLQLLAWSAAIAAVAGIAAALLTYASMHTSESLISTLRNSELMTANWQDSAGSIPTKIAVISSAISGSCVFLLVLLSRSLTFWTDSIFGARSLHLMSRSFWSVILSSIIISSPAEFHWRIAKNLFGNAVTSAAFSPTGEEIVTGFGNGTVKVWNASTGSEVRRLRGHLDSIVSVAYSPDGKRIVSSSLDRTIRIWDSHSGKAVAGPIDVDDYGTSSISFTSDSKVFLTGSCGPSTQRGCDGTARLWDADSGAPLGAIGNIETLITSAAFAIDGARIVSASLSGVAEVWDAETRETISSYSDDRAGSIVGSGMSPDGRLVASVSRDYGSALIWDLQSGNIIQILEMPGKGVNAAVFSPDGTLVATAMSDNSASLWGSDTKNFFAQLQSFYGHAGAVKLAEFSPEGARLLTASTDGTSRVWDIASGDEILVLSAICPSVNALPFMRFKCFSPTLQVDIARLAISPLEGAFLLLLGAVIVIAVAFAASTVSTPLRLLIPSERLRNSRVVTLGMVVAIILLAYSFRLPAESLIIWFGLALIIMPAVSLLRFLLALEFRRAFANRI
ncbi:MAG TPA: WD40 repeat domain-containing protein, partial [Lacipirellulaceae bacterium]|nr:WD40 repeat domain-containing protein [Lacipirellulaceae bacterium]